MNRKSRRVALSMALQTGAEVHPPIWSSSNAIAFGDYFAPVIEATPPGAPAARGSTSRASTPAGGHFLIVYAPDIFDVNDIAERQLDAGVRMSLKTRAGDS
jgi:hypothetical protein